VTREDDALAALLWRDTVWLNPQGGKLGQQEHEHLSRIMAGAALSRAVTSIADLGVANLIETGQPQPVEHLARASKTHEPSLYRILRFLASHGVFRENDDRHFDHTPLSAALRTDAPGS
jgi:hypothetical protein